MADTMNVREQTKYNLLRRRELSKPEEYICKALSFCYLIGKQKCQCALSLVSPGRPSEHGLVYLACFAQPRDAEQDMSGSSPVPSPCSSLSRCCLKPCQVRLGPVSRGRRERAGQHGWLSPRSASRLSSAVSPARSPDCSLLRRRPSPQRARPLTAAAPQPGRRGGQEARRGRRRGGAGGEGGRGRGGQRARRGTGRAPGQAGVKRRPPQPRGRGRGGARAPPIAGLLARGPEAAPTLRRRRQPGEPWARCRPR